MVTYPALSAILERMTPHRRIQLSRRFPKIRRLERRLPYHFGYVHISDNDDFTLDLELFDFKVKGCGENKTKLTISCHTLLDQSHQSELAPSEVFKLLVDFFLNRKGTTIRKLHFADGSSLDEMSQVNVHRLYQIVFSKAANLSRGLSIPARIVCFDIDHFEPQIFVQLFIMYKAQLREVGSLIEITYLPDDPHYILEKSHCYTSIVSALKEARIDANLLTVPSDPGFNDLQDLEMIHVAMGHAGLLIHHNFGPSNLVILRIFVVPNNILKVTRQLL